MPLLRPAADEAPLVQAGVSVCATVAQAVMELATTRRQASTRPFAELTQREFDVLDLVAQGLDNQAIARRLVLSPKTVRNHVSNVLSKLHVTDRYQAIVLSRQRGLGQGSD
jgi:DNA-binding NarL/FixJ family response regulator